MNYHIRPATMEDVPAILEIVNHAIAHSTAHYGYEPDTLQSKLDWFADLKAKHMPILVADDGKGAVGYGAYTQFRDREGYRFTVEHSVYVTDAHHGKGVGGALLQSLIDLARESGIRVMIAGMDAENKGSFAFHKRFGFEEVGRFREVGYKFDRWLDVIFMQLML